MKLHNYWRSSSSWRVRLVLALKEVDYEYIPVNLLSGEQFQPAHRARNPSGAVPVLELENGTYLSQSVAIVEYLEERFPRIPLLPENLEARAQVRMMVESVNSSIQPFQNPFCTKYVREVCKADEKAFTQYFVKAGLASLEQMAATRAGTYLFGEAVSLADCYLMPQLYGARRFEVSLEPYPTLLRVEAQLSRLPAFVRAAPENQPDAPKTS